LRTIDNHLLFRLIVRGLVAAPLRRNVVSDFHGLQGKEERERERERGGERKRARARAQRKCE
jgi:hypothetical protein